VQKQNQTFYFQWTVKDVDDKKKEPRSSRRSSA